MKTFVTSGTGSSQTIKEIQNNSRIPIYDNKDALDNDLDNLKEGQIVATKSSGDEDTLVKLQKQIQLLLNGQSYSLEEVETAKTYKGKTVYRKTFVREDTYPTAISIPLDIDVSDLDIDEVIYINGGGHMYMWGNLYQDYVNFSGTVNTHFSENCDPYSVSYQKSNNSIQVTNAGGHPKCYSYRITIEYIKN